MGTTHSMEPLMTYSELTRESEQEDESDVASKPLTGDHCPECGGTIIQDEEQGEATCEECGLIVDEDTIDRGPDWRAFNAEDRDEKSRVGAPTTPLMHDKGLSTTISWQDKDAHGRTLSGEKRSQIQRLRKWDERFRTRDSKDRNLKQALGEISRMASALGLSESVQETAGVIYRRAVEDGLLPGRSIEGMATASLYAAARQHGIPRQVAEFAQVSRVEQLRIQCAYRYLSRELGLAIEPEDPIQYLPQFASSLNVSDEGERVAREYVVNLLVDEAASVVTSDIMNRLLEQGRGFRLSVGLSMQFPNRSRRKAGDGST